MQKNNPEKRKPCCSCGKMLSLDSFWKNNQIKGGRDNKCKFCKMKGLYCKKKKKEKNKYVKDFGPTLANVSKKDWIEMFKALERIGYTFERSIHEQFCEKHNLKPKVRGFDKCIYYTPKDLGLI